MMMESQMAAIGATMKAMRLHVAGGPGGLEYDEIATPPPKVGEALVRVYAAAITRDELEWAVNRLPAIPSYEVSGVVVAVDAEGDGIQVGEAVYALGPFDREGAAAEYVVIEKKFLAAKPRTLQHIESAAIPLAGLSAWQALFVHGGLEKGQRVLIHGASGGVGSFAVQLAHQRGAYVIGTVSTQDVDKARALGADEVIDYTTTRFEDACGEVDLVFDTVGGDRLERSPDVVRRGGKLVSVATEPSAERAAAFGIEAIFFVVEPNREQLVELARLADSGELKPVIDAVYPLADARAAFERCLGEHRGGKIVLRVVQEL